MRTLVILLSFVLTSVLFANTSYGQTTDTYVFENPVTETRYKALIKELRCPKCQNQNLADSNSPIAADLRREVYELLMQGKSDIEIVDFMVKRYGDFVLYRPKVSSLTYVLWFGPAVLLFIGIVIVMLMVRNKPKQKKQVALSSQQQNQIDELLKDK